MEMWRFATKLLGYALLTISMILACDLDLDFTCTGTNGHYVIVNPDNTVYMGVEAYRATGLECDARVEGVDCQTLVVSNCGMNNVQVVLIGNNGTNTTCTISCDSGTRSEQGYTLPLNVLLASTDVLQPGSAHYSCHDSGVIFIRNPREEVYLYSSAYSMNAEEQLKCHTTHTADNKLIEITGCDTSEGVLLRLRKSPTEDLGRMAITHQSDILFLDCGNRSAPVAVQKSNGASYKCYKDGTIVFHNPRSELYKYSWAVQNGRECTTLYVESVHQVFVTSFDYTKPIILVVSKTPVTAAQILNNADIFLLECRV